MFSNEMEILKAIKAGVLRKFEDEYPPAGKVNKDEFDRLKREGYVHAKHDFSHREKWSYGEVSLTSSGLQLLNSLEKKASEGSKLEWGKLKGKEALKAIMAFTTGTIALIIQKIIINYFTKG
jgi:hypothetical protein